MAMATTDDFMEMDFSGHSTTTTTTTTTTEYDGSCNWDDLSPVVDWEAVSGGGGHHNDLFHGLIESMFDQEVSGCLHAPHGQAWDSPVNSADDYETAADGHDFKGLRLVHLLMAAAEALSGTNKSRELARVILVRLKELLASVSPHEGTNMERLAAHFTDALQGLLECAGGGAHGTHSKHLISGCGPHRDDHHSQTDVLAAFQLLQDMSPYVKFGHFTANQAILEAVANDRRVHIVDYDIMEGIQWASLMQALVSQKDGLPAPHLRITALSRCGSGRRSIATVQETGRRLAAFAASVGQPFSFHQCRLDSDETFRPSTLKLVRGEALVVNCMLHLPHFNYRTPGSVASFLSEAKSLNPRLVTLVEEQVGRPVGDGGFVDRFMDSLHHYSAMYDSLEGGFPMQTRARALVERVFLGPRIVGSLARIYRARGDEEGLPWAEWLGGLGFRPCNMSFANHCQAKLLLGLFNDGYRVEEVASNRLVLGWKSRRLLSASLWTTSSPEPEQ